MRRTGRAEAFRFAASGLLPELEKYLGHKRLTQPG